MTPCWMHTGIAASTHIGLQPSNRLSSSWPRHAGTEVQGREPIRQPHACHAGKSHHLCCPHGDHLRPHTCCSLCRLHLPLQLSCPASRQSGGLRVHVSGTQPCNPSQHASACLSHQVTARQLIAGKHAAGQVGVSWLVMHGRNAAGEPMNLVSAALNPVNQLALA